MDKLDVPTNVRLIKSRLFYAFDIKDMHIDFGLHPIFNIRNISHNIKTSQEFQHNFKKSPHMYMKIQKILLLNRYTIKHLVYAHLVFL